MVRYVQPKGCLMTLQVSLELQHQSAWSFRTIFGQRKCVRRCSIVTSQHIQDGGRPPFWRSLNHHISVKNRAILIKFGTLQQILRPMTVTWPKIEIFKIQDGGGHHLENSSTDCPISAKFSMRKENGMSTRVTWQKLQIFLIQDHGRPPFWKSLNRHISVKNRPILMKFGTLHQILNPVTDTWPKIEILKIQDGGVRYLENCFYGHKSSTDCPISAKFCMRKQNGRSTRETWQKLHIFKIQDGGRPLFWKSLNCHTSVEKSSHFD